MKKILFSSLAVFFSISSFASELLQKKKSRVHDEPLLQFGYGWTYSNIDLTRYTNSVLYKGIHTRLVTHVAGLFSLSTEYSVFPVHVSEPAWEDVHAKKIDINPQISFYTNNKRTRIFIFTGANYHEWSARRTAYMDVDQLASHIAPGNYVQLKKWGANFGCGFNATLYENIAVFGDYRFAFTRTLTNEKIRVMDVMTTVGLCINIPYPQRSDKPKSFGIGKKIYKWTEKGGK